MPQQTVEEVIHDLKAEIAANQNRLAQADQVIQGLNGRIAALETTPAPQQAAAAAPPPRKWMPVPKFGNRPEDDWLTYRQQFEHITSLNQMTQNEIKLALAGSITGSAAATISDILVNDPTKDGAGLLDAYEARFLPASASELAKVTFEAATQLPKETALNFHGRVRNLYNRAYTRDRNEEHMTRRFILGLRSKEVREMVMRARPQNYEAALYAAQNENAVRHVTTLTQLGARVPQGGVAGGDEPMEVNAVYGLKKPGGMGHGRPQGQRTDRPGGARGGQDRTFRNPAPAGAGAAQPTQVRGNCYFCKETGHWKKHCPLFGKALRMAEKMDQKTRKMVAALALGEDDEGEDLIPDQAEEEEENWDDESPFDTGDFDGNF